MEETTTSSTGIGDVAAEIIDEVKNLTTQERIKIKDLFKALQASENQKAEQLYREIHEVNQKVETIAARQSGFIKVWAWLKNSIAHASEEAKKIRIE